MNNHDEFSANSLDIAISGDGFFPLESSDGTKIYTRNGGFSLNEQNQMVNAAGQALQSLPVDSTNKADFGEPLSALNIPRVTVSEFKATTEVELGLNLPSEVEPITATFNPSKEDTYHKTTSLTVYGASGSDHLATIYYVKTANAIRKVPVHPQLMELGFIDYVTSLRKQKKDRLFWELTKTRDGYAKQLSRHFNEKYLRALGVWERNVKVLYCTRHTFVNALYQNKVDENVIKALVGHEKEFTMKHYGGEPFSPDRLLQEISKVNYKGIKWDRLKI